MFAVYNIQYETINNCMLARVSSVMEKIVPKKLRRIISNATDVSLLTCNIYIKHVLHS